MTAAERHLAAVLHERQCRQEVEAIEAALHRLNSQHIVASDRFMQAVQATAEARQALEPVSP